MNYLQITIPTAATDLQEILIAQLDEVGYEGFEQQETQLMAYVPDDRFDAEDLRELLEPFGLEPVVVRMENKNWNEEWEKNFQPVVVEDFCAIRAYFHAPIEGVAHELVITPKMSFGTGHHATTYMMLQAMGRLDLRGKKVFDFGTGTGVLAILAEKLGAVDVLAVDNDDWSIENALENVSTNDCRSIRVQKMDKVPEGEGGYDVILANINKHVILAQLETLGQQLKEEGVILLSGLLENDFQDIENEAVKNKLSISERMTRGNWICLKTEKKDQRRR
jgi:ribosomal protein L11 methyltransferase